MLSLPDLRNPDGKPPAAPAKLPRSRRAEREDPAHYVPDEGLADAMRVALLLRKPLLLTGEPGTGKTQAAWYLNWKLGYADKLLMFEAKSTASARDLFYTYNTLGRFHAVQTREGSQNSIDYITYNALGAAILRANPLTAVEKYLPSDFLHGGEARQSVVLIDEVDKAPRDFPNDILNEVENMYFRIPEFGNVRIAADEELAPVLVITSNSEKNLPAAFLRRCIYYHIPPPNRERLERIVAVRISELAETPLLKDSMQFFMELRNPNSGLQKPPATAELLDWLLYLRARGVPISARLRAARDVAAAGLGALIKDQDQESALNLLDGWLKTG